MLVCLALSIAFLSVSAEYGRGAGKYPYRDGYRPSKPGYYPYVYDSSYWDDSRERKREKCPKLQAYVGELPGITTEAFYPPIIRYVKQGKRLTAYVVCDRNKKNINFLFGRRNSSSDVRSAHFVAMGTTAGVTLRCNRDERRFEGLVVNTSNTNGFSTMKKITQLTCLGLAKTHIGFFTEHHVKHISEAVGAQMISENMFGKSRRSSRKKRDTAAATDTNDNATTTTSGTDKTSSEGSTPASTAPASTTSASTAPASTTSAKTAPASTAPASTTSANTTPASTAPASTTSAKTAPASTTSAKTAPASTTSAKTAPASTTSANTTPASTAPASTTSANTARASTTSANTARASTTSANTAPAITSPESATSASPTSASPNSFDEALKDFLKTLEIIF